MISAKRTWKRRRFAASVDLRLEDRRGSLEDRGLIHVNAFLFVICRKSRLYDRELSFGELDCTQRIGFVVLSNSEDRARAKYHVVRTTSPPGTCWDHQQRNRDERSRVEGNEQLLPNCQ